MLDLEVWHKFLDKYLNDIIYMSVALPTKVMGFQHMMISKGAFGKVLTSRDTSQKSFLSKYDLV